MPVCVVKLCKNNTTRNKKDTGITYHQFPADPVICDRWTAIVRLSREEIWWKPGKRSVICSAHFNESDFYFTKSGLRRLCKGAVPQNALFLSSIPPDNISDNSTVTAEPSTSAPVVNSNNSAVTAESSTSVSVVEGTILTIHTDTPPLDDFPDIDHIFDTPRKIKLKKELHKTTILQLKHGRIIKTLREKTRRLKKVNYNLKSIIKSLKQERFIDNDIYNILSKNIVAADLFNNIYKKHKNEKKILPKYTNELKKFCLTLNFYSPSAYNYVRSKFSTCLPHPKTLGKWYRNIDGAPGFTEEASKFAKMCEFQKANVS